MKNFLPPLLLALAIQPLQANIINDSEQIMNDAQQVYSELFPAEQTTQELTPYRYRFYPGTGIYLGIHQENSGVYLLGGPFGDVPFFVDSAENVKSLLKNQLKNSNHTTETLCDTRNMPDEFTYQQEGNDIYVSTNGQCVVVPESRNVCTPQPETDENQQAIATGLHILSQSTISNFEITGLSFPGLDDILRDAASQKTCIIHAPAELANHTIHTDICIDITNQLGDISSIPGIEPPVTNRFTSVSSSSKVDDCFTTNAFSITNLVTEQHWTNQNGTFVLQN